MWTGPLVVSKHIPTIGIRDLARQLKHPIVLWDNLHANDYDQRRVFLGPYSGRPMALRRRQLLRGILTNPNCEFEANYIAMHTLAQWTRQSDPVHAASVSVETDLADQGDDSEEIVSGDKTNCSRPPRQAGVPLYRPREALRIALRDWLTLMLQVGHLSRLY
ncbi:unnamed protein product [Protopolystoma xenopodis]|uniref:GH84 domain-containing protein n=1 Tax=Protopolystoma xenopodis TaxID=117903 RepID=A0A3S5CVF0_9PLAT|nr:unnamed protein product [Protopolystoma xenopodis]